MADGREGSPRAFLRDVEGMSVVYICPVGESGDRGPSIESLGRGKLTALPSRAAVVHLASTNFPNRLGSRGSG